MAYSHITKIAQASRQMYFSGNTFSRYCQACNMFLICLEVVSSFKCLVVYLWESKENKRLIKSHLWIRLNIQYLSADINNAIKMLGNYKMHTCKILLFTDLSALRRPSTLLGGWNRSTLMHPFIYIIIQTTVNTWFHINSIMNIIIIIIITNNAK